MVHCPRIGRDEHGVALAAVNAFRTTLREDLQKGSSKAKKNGRSGKSKIPGIKTQSQVFDDMKQQIRVCVCVCVCV